MKHQLSKTSCASIEEHDPRWLAVVNREHSADGQFYLAVKTTGIYCIPSCPAPIPKLVNAIFFQHREQAEAAGFRACKRCKPDQWEFIQKSKLVRHKNKAINAKESTTSLHD